MSESFAKIPGYTFLKANKVFSGSHEGMRFCMEAAEDALTARVWPNPWCIEKTDAAQIESAQFAMTEEGMAEAEQWVEERFAAEPQRWKESREHPLG